MLKSMTVTAHNLVTAYLDDLATGRDVACREYAADDREAWTRRACLALVKAGRCVATVAEAATRGGPDCYRRSEYLSLDVMLYEDAHWGPPVFIAEHENFGGMAKVQYCAWKVLVVEAQWRVLVAYFGRGTEFSSFPDLQAAVDLISQHNCNRTVVLVGGDNGVRPQSVADLRQMHQWAMIGAPFDAGSLARSVSKLPVA